MKSARRGSGTSRVEVTNVSREGFSLLIGRKKRFIRFEDFPWFRDASIAQITNVTLPSAHHLHQRRPTRRRGEIEADAATLNRDGLFPPDRPLQVGLAHRHESPIEEVEHLLVGVGATTKQDDTRPRGTVTGMSTRNFTHSAR
jgi:hypothetical protein